MEPTRVAKPNSSPDKPVFYRPQDFAIGSVVEVFKHRFVITDADKYVLKYMEAHASEFPAETVESLRSKHDTQPASSGSKRD